MHVCTVRRPLRISNRGAKPAVELYCERPYSVCRKVKKGTANTDLWKVHGFLTSRHMKQKSICFLKIEFGTKIYVCIPSL